MTTFCQLYEGTKTEKEVAKNIFLIDFSLLSLVKIFQFYCNIINNFYLMTKINTKDLKKINLIEKIIIFFQAFNSKINNIS
jgi:hypothetical protein